MYATSINGTLTLAGFAPAGKLSHAYCGLLPVLALLVATPGWSQSTPIFRGSHPSLNMQMAASSAEPAADTPASAHYRFLTIGPVDAQNVYAEGIDNAGLVTGFYEDASSNYHGFVWHDGVFKTVDYPGAANTFLYGVNNLGVAIGFYGAGYFQGANNAVTYSVPTGTWTALPDVPNQLENFGYGINDRGVAVGSALGVPWIWDPTTLSYYFLNVPGADPYSTFPVGLNDKGQVVGYSAGASYTQNGFVEEGGVYTSTDVPGAANTLLLGINNRGTIVGTWGNAAGTYQGFLTSGGQFVNVNYPGQAVTGIDGINDRGDLCGYYSASSSGPNKAFIAIAQ